MPKKPLGLAIATLIAASACIPLPHHEHDWPAIDGQLTQAGKPLGGVPIGLTVKNGEPACRPDGAPEGDLSLHGACRCVVAETDAQGHFHIANASRLEWFIWFGDKFDAWSLCFALPGGAATWDERGMLGGPDSERLTCAMAPSTDGGTRVDCEPARL